MKKATTKRDRKYGKKDTDGIQVSESSKERVVKVMVDYGSILKFKTQKEAETYVNKKKKEAEKRGQPETSYIFI